MFKTHRTLNGEHKTNNYQEGWHRGLQRKIMSAGGKSIDFVRVLQEDCADTIQKFYRYY